MNCNVWLQVFLQSKLKLCTKATTFGTRWNTFIFRRGFLSCFFFLLFQHEPKNCVLSIRCNNFALKVFWKCTISNTNMDKTNLHFVENAFSRICDWNSGRWTYMSNMSTTVLQKEFQAIKMNHSNQVCVSFQRTKQQQKCDSMRVF